MYYNFSPMSIAIALGMLFEGLYGDTKSQLKEVFLGNSIDDKMV